VLVAGCTADATSGSSPGAPTSAASPTPGSAAAPAGVSSSALAREVCANDKREVLLRTLHGVQVGRSGDIQVIPRFPNFMGAGLPHATPYDYTQEVPLFIYGPGVVKPGVYRRTAYLTDIAPTEGAILKYPFEAPDGTAQTQALVPASSRGVPRLIVTLVWDSGGMDVLRTWPRDWPYLASLKPHGAWFTNVTVGASPSNTPTGHAEIGTGAFPMHNGFTDDYIELAGRIQKPNANGPAFLEVPTLADLYDRAMGNRPLVGASVTLSAHVMMMGHGSLWGGGDRDIAITRELTGAATAGAEATRWNLAPQMAPFYRIPAWVNDLPPLSHYVRKIDGLDGKLDGEWRGNSIAQLLNGFDTPARTPFQTTLIEALIKREGFGRDDVPDLLFLNYKAIDVIGHMFSANSIEMSDALRIQDEALRALVGFLDRVVGKGRWAMVLTADHGTQRSPTVSHAFVADITRFTQDIQRRFDHDGDGRPLVVWVRPTQLWVDPAELADNHVTLTQISEYIMTLTQAQTIRAGVTPNPATANDRVFAAALPTSMLGKLPCLAKPGSGG
jgi:Type I phosphodiesterase / nucleotide pyrophosphatase